MNSRKPNWEKWKLIPDANVWQVVALSLDIDPDRVTKYADDWKAGGRFVNHEGDQFRDRVDIIRANIKTIAHLSRAIDKNGIEYNELNIANFAQWAISNNIVIPDQMKALANGQTTSEKEMFDVSNSNYPRELHIAVMAWQAVSNMQSLKVSPKAKLREWLDNKYSDNELTNAARERISTVANWNKTGGAPKTE